jgi:hypothetical protein
MDEHQNRTHSTNYCWAPPPPSPRHGWRIQVLLEAAEGGADGFGAAEVGEGVGHGVAVFEAQEGGELLGVEFFDADFEEQQPGGLLGVIKLGLLPPPFSKTENGGGGTFLSASPQRLPKSLRLRKSAIPRTGQNTQIQ